MCRVSYRELVGCPPLVVTHSLIVKQDHSWLLHVHGHVVDTLKVPSLDTIPTELNGASVTLMLSRVAELNTCPGNPEPKFIALGESKKNGLFVFISQLRSGSLCRLKCMCSSWRTTVPENGLVF